MPERFCLGCGVSVACLKNYDKRLLCGEASGKMLAAWKELFSRKLDELVNVRAIDIDVNELARSSSNPQYVCRKCFSAYERFQQHQRELLEKVGVAVSKFLGGHYEPDDVTGRAGAKRSRAASCIASETRPP